MLTNALNSKQNALLESYTDNLLRWNAIHNLSGARDKSGIQDNIKSSLYPLRFLDSKPSVLLDVGSGNGFPAVPLGIALEIPTILCEQNAKKAAFLQNIQASIPLENFTIKHQKIESLSLDLDPITNLLITSRATFSLQTLLQKCQHLITPQTTLLLYKGSRVKNEIPNHLKYRQFSENLIQYIVILGKDLIWENG